MERNKKVNITQYNKSDEFLHAFVYLMPHVILTLD
jgi:hypothetical protein